MSNPAPILVRSVAVSWFWLAVAMCLSSVPAVAGDPAAAEGTTIRSRGRIDTDAIWTSQSDANEATFGDLGNAFGLRRAWIGIEGDLAIGGRYVAEIDLAS